jgi:hypothetical protein
MANLLISHVNLADAGTLSTASEITTLPVANLQDRIVAKKWRSNADLVPTVDLDLGAAHDIRVLALAGCNLASTDTIRVRLSLTGAGNSEVLDTGADPCGVVDGYGFWLLVLAAAVSARYVRLDFAASAPLTYVEAGRLWVGDAVQPARNYGYGGAEQWNDDSIVQRAPRSGAEYVERGPKWRSWAFALPALTAAEGRGTVKELLRVAGISGQVLAVPDPDSAYAPKEALIGRLARALPIQHPHFDIRSAAFEVFEGL